MHGSRLVALIPMQWARMVPLEFSKSNVISFRDLQKVSTSKTWTDSLNRVNNITQASGAGKQVALLTQS